MLNIVAAQRFGEDGGISLGVLHAVRGLGTGLGPILLGKLLPRSINLPTLITLSAIVSFLYVESFALSLLCLLLWGMGSGHNWVSATTALQQNSPSPILGRLTAFDYLSLTISQSMACLLGGICIDYGWGSSISVWIALMITSPLLILLFSWEIQWARERRSPS